MNRYKFNYVLPSYTATCTNPYFVFNSYDPLHNFTIYQAQLSYYYDKIRKYSNEYKTSPPVNEVQPKKPIMVKWVPPDENGLKLNIDGASRDNPSRAGCGGIVRNSRCQVVFAFSEFLYQGSTSYVEMSGLCTGLLICYQLGISKITVETDSMLLVNWFQGKTRPPCSLSKIWDKIQELAIYIDVKIQHIFREGNSVADLLAKQGSRGVSEQYFTVDDLPIEVKSSWENDFLGRGSWRQPR